MLKKDTVKWAWNFHIEKYRNQKEWYKLFKILTYDKENDLP